jgi:lipopolysaccharide transport system ATP-binding protein
MNDIAIKVEGLSKAYRIGLKEQRHETLFGAAAAFLKAPLSNFRDLRKLSRFEGDDEEDKVWALRDISFEVKQGEAVGIIGRNGAGKSTLLKILALITEPTTGRATVYGRIGSLLEVGTGFHPDLTGRENIYLNGTILGMRKREIDVKFDEIVDFSGVEKFIDTPVKRYSSGMRVRLAFSVAAHLEPEILIVDEVLAVGDAEFQKKCLGKMSEVAKAGRTVLFVSHNMEAVDRLTSRCVSLRGGRLNLDGKTFEVVADYLRNGDRSVQDLAEFRVSSVPKTVRIAETWTETLEGEKIATFRQGEPIRIVLRVESADPLNCDFGIVIENSQQQALYTTHLSDLSKTLTTDHTHLLTAEIRNPMLRKGDYLVCLAAFSPDRRTFYDLIQHFPLFEVAGTKDKSFPDDFRWGNLYVPIDWKVGK